LKQTRSPELEKTLTTEFMCTILGISMPMELPAAMVSAWKTWENKGLHFWALVF